MLPMYKTTVDKILVSVSNNDNDMNLISNSTIEFFKS